MYASTSDFKALLLVKKGKLYLLDRTVVMDLDQEPITLGSGGWDIYPSSEKSCRSHACNGSML